MSLKDARPLQVLLREYGIPRRAQILKTTQPAVSEVTSTREKFEAIFLAKRTKAGFAEWRCDCDFHIWKHAM